MQQIEPPEGNNPMNNICKLIEFTIQRTITGVVLMLTTQKPPGGNYCIGFW